MLINRIRNIISDIGALIRVPERGMGLVFDEIVFKGLLLVNPAG